MAFPTGYTLYQEVTIDKTKVSGTNGDFPTLVDLSDMVKVGADIFDTCRTDGGDIRVTLTDGTTQLPREIVSESFDKSAKVGEMWISISSLTDSVDLVLRVYYNGIDTEPAAGSTYGSESVYGSGTLMVQHMAQDPSGSAPQMIDSTSLNNDGTSEGSMTSGDLVDAQIYKGIATDGTDDAINFGQNIFSGEVLMAATFWAEVDTDNFDGTLKAFLDDSSTAPASNDGFYCIPDDRGGGNPTNGIQIEIGTTGSSRLGVFNNIFTDTPTFYKISFSYSSGTDIELYINGVAQSGTLSGDLGNFVPRINADLLLSAFNSVGLNFNSIYDEVRLWRFIPGADWELTEYNNQSSPSTFYSVSDEQGGSPPVAATQPIITIQT